MEQELIERVVKAKQPRVSSSMGMHILEVDGEEIEISPEDADLLFRTMFFRSKI